MSFLRLVPEESVNPTSVVPLAVFAGSDPVLHPLAPHEPPTFVLLGLDVLGGEWEEEELGSYSLLSLLRQFEDEWPHLLSSFSFSASRTSSPRRMSASIAVISPDSNLSVISLIFYLELGENHLIRIGGKLVDRFVPKEECSSKGDNRYDRAENEPRLDVFASIVHRSSCGWKQLGKETLEWCKVTVTSDGEAIARYRWSGAMVDGADSLGEDVFDWEDDEIKEAVAAAIGAEDFLDKIEVTRE